MQGLETLSLSCWGGCSEQPVGGTQPCCPGCYNAQDRPLQQNIHGVEVETPALVGSDGLPSCDGPRLSSPPDQSVTVAHSSSKEERRSKPQHPRQGTVSKNGWEAPQ